MASGNKLIDTLPALPTREPKPGEERLFETYVESREIAIRSIKDTENSYHPNSGDYKFHMNAAIIAIGRCIGLHEAINLLA